MTLKSNFWRRDFDLGCVLKLNILYHPGHIKSRAYSFQFFNSIQPLWSYSTLHYKLIYSWTSISFPLHPSVHPISGIGWFKARSQAPSDWGEPAEKEEGGNGSHAASQARAKHSRVGADQDGDRSPPTHQRSGLHLETEAQISGECFQQTFFFCPSTREWVYIILPEVLF